MSPIAVYKFGEEVKNILRSHNYIEKYGRKCNTIKRLIKRHKDSKVTTQNVA